MKKYILTIASICVTLLVVIVVSVFWFSYNRQLQVRESLKTILQVIDSSEIPEDYQAWAYGIEGVGVSVFDRQRNILADNSINIDILYNFDYCPEIIDAEKNGYGEDIRLSEITGRKNLYIASRLKNGLYIRLAHPISLTSEFLRWLLVPICFLMIILAALVFAFAKNRQAEVMRQQFVANVSHELKTPLTTIKGYAELTATGLISDSAAIKEYQGHIVSQSDRLLSSINDILFLSKLENTRPKDLIWVDTRKISEQVSAALKFMADEKGIIIQVTGQGRIKAETEPIYAMIYNLVDNSIKYGNNGGYVKIILDGRKITVADNGIGIPHKDIERVFERFYSVDKSRKSGGTGLGLAIVKHTAKKFGGSIVLKSEDGTQIFLEFGKKSRLSFGKN